MIHEFSNIFFSSLTMYEIMSIFYEDITNFILGPSN